MKLDLTKPVQLRNGRKARVITTTFKNNFPVLVAVESQIDPNLEILLSFSRDGRISGLHVYSETEAENCQLINVPEPPTMKEVWIGFEQDCYRAAGNAQIYIATRPEKLRGHRGPLKVHLCGDFYNLPGWSDIYQDLINMETLYPVERVYHHGTPPVPVSNYAAEMAALKEELDRHADQMRAILLKFFRENDDSKLT